MADDCSWCTVSKKRVILLMLLFWKMYYISARSWLCCQTQSHRALVKNIYVSNNWRYSGNDVRLLNNNYIPKDSHIAVNVIIEPKGVQEKRAEVLENKVDRMWVSNAFFEWTHVKSSTSEGRRQCCSSFLRNLTFSVICDKMLNITHYNKPTSLCC